MKIILFNKSIKPAITSLLEPLHDHNKGRAEKLIRRYATFLEKRRIHCGERTTLAIAKSLANNVKKAAFGLSNSYDYPCSVAVDELMIPRELNGFRRFVRSKSPVLKAVAISISNLYRLAVIDPKPSYKDVLDPYNGDDSVMLCKFLDFIRIKFAPTYQGLFMEAVRYRIDNDLQQTTVMASASPSGKVSAFTADCDAAALLSPRFRHIMNSVTVMYKSFGASHKLENLISLAEISKPEKYASLAAYSFIPDKGGKTRGITLANYYLQDSLKTMHDDLMYVLAKMPNDFTYKQSTVVNRLKDYFIDGKKAYCYDMTGATDRFPRFVQSYLLTQLYGRRVAWAWDTLMRVPISHSKNVISFACGQPMGLYSSFATFALTHHALVQYCFHKMNVKRHLYMLLGDDIVIFHKRVSLMYEDVLTSVLGVKISKHKSILSEATFCAEFCKKLVHDGHDISPIGSGLLVPPHFDPEGVANRISIIYSWDPTNQYLLDSSLRSVYRILGWYPSVDSKAFAIYLYGLASLPVALRQRIIKEAGVTREHADRVSYIHSSNKRVLILNELYKSSNKYDKLSKASLDRISKMKGVLLHPYAQELNDVRSSLCTAIDRVTMYCTGSRVIELEELDSMLNSVEHQGFLLKGLLNYRKINSIEVCDEYKRQETVLKITELSSIYATVSRCRVDPET